MEYQDVQTLVSINVVALTELFHIFLRRIKQQHKKLSEKQKASEYTLAGIINISSMSGFMLIPSMALYTASKAFVLLLTKSVYAEQHNKGCNLHVVVSCPGTTKAEIWSKGRASEKSLVLPVGTKEHVCATTLAALDACDKPVIIPGYFNKLQVASLRLAPHSLIRFLSQHLMGQDFLFCDADEVKEAFARMGRTLPTRT